MRQLIPSALLWFSAIGCGVMCGVYFSFSTFVMSALARIAPAAGIAAFNSMNVVIVRSFFMPLFLGTTLTAAALAAIAIFRWGEPGSLAMLIAGTVYVVGMFIVTIIFNVPLNNALAVVDPTSIDGAATWTRSVKEWSLWNHVRTITSLLASVLFTAALAAK
jgi:uncharacterized membrane protein